MRTLRWSGIAAGWLLLASAAQGADLTPLLKQLHAVGVQGAGSAEAAAAWSQIVRADASALPELLSALDGANPLAANYLRSAIDTIAERQLKAGGSLPQKELEAHVLNTAHAPRARRLAFEWLTRVDPSAPDRLIPGMLDDPSVELRRDAVARVIEAAAATKDQTQAQALYQKAFDASVDEDQVKQTAEKLKEFGVTVDLARHYGFLMRWHIVGPFDNTGQKGFNVAYPPEKAIDMSASYQGKLPELIKWREHETKDENGMVDLVAVLGKNKGSIGYCVSYFQSDRPQKVEFRLSSYNAIKLWLNGQLIDQREVYHSGNALDQYISTGTLVAGTNVILLKLCENEQTESWAQDWSFQLRICNPTGTAVLSTDRK